MTYFEIAGNILLKQEYISWMVSLKSVTDELVQISNEVMQEVPQLAKNVQKSNTKEGF